MLDQELIFSRNKDLFKIFLSAEYHIKRLSAFREIFISSALAHTFAVFSSRAVLAQISVRITLRTYKIELYDSLYKPFVSKRDVRELLYEPFNDLGQASPLSITYYF